MEIARADVMLRFDAGTLLIEGPQEVLDTLAGLSVPDPRVGAHRAEARHYRAIRELLTSNGHSFIDRAAAFEALPLRLCSGRAPRRHQDEALEAWLATGGRGVAAMPTGAGKSHMAMMAMERIGMPTLVVAPTIDLVQQWASSLEQAFGIEVGMLGGGSKDIRPVTASTYDSAALCMEFLGARFGLLVLDECHHLPARFYQGVASMCLAPWRLGLSATPERDGDPVGNRALVSLCGPIIYHAHIDELDEGILAPYDVRTVNVDLTMAEEAAYRDARARYLDFVKSNGISFASRRGWGDFIGLCARVPGGRDAFAAYLEQRRIARCSSGKLDALWELIKRHRGERVIVFTADNDTAYEIGCRFALPVITHKTKAAERKDFLDKFRSGHYPVLVSSRVLNEGVDVPEAQVGVILSGSGSVREHVQRLGRILRAASGKRAVLYEVLSEGTAEKWVSGRRRMHRAYEGFDQVPQNRG